MKPIGCGSTFLNTEVCSLFFLQTLIHSIKDAKSLLPYDVLKIARTGKDPICADIYAILCDEGDTDSTQVVCIITVCVFYYVFII